MGAIANPIHEFEATRAHSPKEDPSRPIVGTSREEPHRESNRELLGWYRTGRFDLLKCCTATPAGKNRENFTYIVLTVEQVRENANIIVP